VSSSSGNPVAVVTGGAGGIGTELVAGLIDAGYSVVIADVNEARVQENLKSLPEGRATAVVGDLADEATIDRIFTTTIETFGRLDLLVNNAGITGPVGSFNTLVADFERVMRINVTSMFAASVKAARIMEAQGGGAIVNTASTSSYRSTRVTPIPAYDASKGAVASLTRALAVEWAPLGIRVNAVAPGPLATAMSFPLPPELEAEKLAPIPMKRRGTPDEIVGAVIFLASPAARYITGHTLVVDGGMLA
jgi:NAD(P)-dependent dehydrogenase (short-subunit alcohol dehydrogenase family)